MILVCAILVVGCTATTKEELTESGLKRLFLRIAQKKA